MAVFTPLWISDAITFLTAAQELRRTYHATSLASDLRRNTIVAQLNRLKGASCVATFKALLAMREDGHWPQLSILIVCSPYLFAAIARLQLHLAKRPVPPPEGQTGRPMRPGTPFNPCHPVILLLACRADGVITVSWATTFWPLWTLFAFLSLACLAATVL